MLEQNATQSEITKTCRYRRHWGRGNIPHRSGSRIFRWLSISHIKGGVRKLHTNSSLIREPSAMLFSWQYTYKKATRDFSLSHITPAQASITAYGGHTIQVAGLVQLKVWRGVYQCKLDCKLVDCENIQPLLGRKACLGLTIITYLDNDSMNKPSTKTAAVFALEVGT